MDFCLGAKPDLRRSRHYRGNSPDAKSSWIRLCETYRFRIEQVSLAPFGKRLLKGCYASNAPSAGYIASFEAPVMFFLSFVKHLLGDRNEKYVLCRRNPHAVAHFGRNSTGVGRG